MSRIQDRREQLMENIDDIIHEYITYMYQGTELCDRVSDVLEDYKKITRELQGLIRE